MHRETFIAKLTEIQQNAGSVAGPIAVERARQVCGSPLPVTPGIPLPLRASRKERQADRAMCHLDLPSCGEHGIQGRLPAVGGTAANWRLNP
jgi:hypothetical protein